MPALENDESGVVLKWGSNYVRVPRLKHDVVFLMCSTIATQIYGCEYKLHLDYAKGRLISEEAVMGIVEHERQLGVRGDSFDLEPGWNPVLVNRGEEGISFFNSRVKNGWIGKQDFSKPYIAEAAIAVVYKNVPILGLPDLIINIDGRPKYIVELKTTSNPERLVVVKEREAFQLALYAYMLRRLGVDIKGGYVLKVLRGTRFRLIDKIDYLMRMLEAGPNRAFIDKNVVLHKVEFEDDFLIERQLDFALGYWLNRRNPIARPCLGLCRICEHRRICGFSSVR